MRDFLSDHHVVNGLYPVADAFATAGTTDYVSLANYRRATWFIHTGVATSGTANGAITVLAASDAAATGAGAVAFTHRKCLSSPTVDTWSDPVVAPTTGLVMTVGSNIIYMIEVQASDIEGADPGNPWVALKVTEDTNDPVVAASLCFLSDPRYPVSTPVSAIA